VVVGSPLLGKSFQILSITHCVKNTIPQHMTMEILFLTLDRHKNMTGLNKGMGYKHKHMTGLNKGMGYKHKHMTGLNKGMGYKHKHMTGLTIYFLSKI
jgi:hypothetical protein